MALPWDFSSDHCPVVYHYTSIEAARAIVENRTFRLSEYTALNDASEFSYARDRLIGLMRDRQVYTDLTTRIFVVSELEGLTANTGLMIGSLTPRRDDLGQWRSYAGDGGGCVLGLDARHLEHDAGVAIRTVVYDEALVDRMLCLGLGVVQQQLEDDPDDHPTLSDYARRLCVDLFSMKHPGFADEREVRIPAPAKQTRSTTAQSHEPPSSHEKAARPQRARGEFSLDLCAAAIRPRTHRRRRSARCGFRRQHPRLPPAPPQAHQPASATPTAASPDPPLAVPPPRPCRPF